MESIKNRSTFFISWWPDACVYLICLFLFLLPSTLLSLQLHMCLPCMSPKEALNLLRYRCLPNAPLGTENGTRVDWSGVRTWIKHSPPPPSIQLFVSKERIAWFILSARLGAGSRPCCMSLVFHACVSQAVTAFTEERQGTHLSN